MYVNTYTTLFKIKLALFSILHQTLFGLSNSYSHTYMYVYESGILIHNETFLSTNDNKKTYMYVYESGILIHNDYYNIILFYTHKNTYTIHKFKLALFSVLYRTLFGLSNTYVHVCIRIRNIDSQRKFFYE